MASPSDAREILGVASVIGITFRPADVEELIERPLEPVAFDHLVDSSLIAPHDDEQWRFGHALIRDAAYAGMLASRRRVLHGRLADRLQGVSGTPPGQIAAHRVAAGDAVRAIPLLREAAERAVALGAVAEAAAFWRQAADLAEPDDPAGAAVDRARAAEAVEALSMTREVAMRAASAASAASAREADR